VGELPSEIYASIVELCEAGDDFASVGDFPDALDQYWAAWDLLPGEKTQWEAATWLLAAIGDANFLSEDYVAGRDNLSLAMHCPKAIGNPFLHLRLGQCQYELGEFRRAADELARAYLLEGAKLFSNDDPKYLAFVKSKLIPPPGGWPEDGPAV